ncbi:16S rRNA (cytosine(1402)-N(4))-methyltransferase RsmH [Leptolyngbya sp. NIES-2104]|uniref:16S rRNA (cytosine(1402)-N(4))-methyltransferase RsmH n=1 Tax=Leptolyngbya sp. NIES-2104 TaxID=1552121 RepID=UPI0006EC6292|nr:16S rRNA (cytosine(1402)-N(4))-methyltransferase RsmH [Leptolyngbya sp. NIES-2104]GAP97250.1 rRNA small subunit methyltransferase H [Leptolyngbya sp. NIES-2104]
MSSEFFHVPVLSREVIEELAIHSGGEYLDATVGGGGHSSLILAAASDVKLTAIDQDEFALSAAREKLGDRVTFFHTNFAEFDPGEAKFDGILADLGVSSAQFDIADRGFSFRHEAALDMRMNQRQELTAAEIINHWEESKLADIFYTYGEERLSRRIARRIVERRPFKTTIELADAIAHSVPKQYRYGRIHPATRVFQGLRIAVNRELEVLETLMQKAPTWLKPGGRLAIISFHSLEDRIVKHRMKESELLTVITKKPIVAQEDEIQENVRSRSAKLRIAERKSIDCENINQAN